MRDVGIACNRERSKRRNRLTPSIFHALCATLGAGPQNRERGAMTRLPLLGSASGSNACHEMFRINSSESVEELQLLCERSDLLHIFAVRKLSLLCRIPRLDNGILRTNCLLHCRSSEFRPLVCDFNVLVCTSNLEL